MMAAQEIGEHVPLAMLAHFFGCDVAGVGHRLSDGMVLGQELERGPGGRDRRASRPDGR